MLNSFFGGKKDRPKKKKKPVEDVRIPEPSPSLPPEAALPEATTTPSPVASP
jgi:hypothetical protein